MENLLSPAPLIRLDGKDFEVLKETRLNPGKVLRSQNHDIYARLGPKQTTREEQIHTVSLHERGFPVPTVLKSGAYGDSEWFFTETSLGETPFHEQFAKDFTGNGVVSDVTFERYLQVVERYTSAQNSASNRTSVSAQDFVSAVIPHEEIVGNYSLLGRNLDRYHTAIDQAVTRLQDAPMGVLQFDLNPFNILDGGIIDFELVGYGPIGYDTLMSARWHRYFTSYPSRYPLAYALTPQQIALNDQLVDTCARSAGVSEPSRFLREFTLIKTAWGFSSHKSIFDEPESKRWFYNYRAELLEQTVDAYLAGKSIDCFTFPDITPTPHPITTLPN